MNAPPLLLRRRRAAALGLLWPPLSVFLLLLPEPALRAALPPASVPLLGLCALLHWAGRRSIALPVVFLLGLFADALYGAPLGLHGALFALAFAAVRATVFALDGPVFALRWLTAAAAAAGVLLLAGLGASLLAPAGKAAGASAPFLPWLATVAAYPFVARLLAPGEAGR